LKFRTDLEISQQESAGQTVYVIKDPRTGRFYRLKAMEYYIASQLDGSRAFADIADDFTAKFNARISADQVEKFVNNLATMGLLEDIFDQKPVTARKKKRSLFGKVLFIKIKAMNPEKFIEATRGLTGVFYSGVAAKIYIFLALIAVIITIANFGDMKYQLASFFRPEIIPMAWITIFFVTVIHELSHSYSCRLHGGKVTDMGFLLLYFQPCFYSNISDAYMFPDRKKRMAVTLAGIISQVVVWAIATVVWRLTSMDNIINTVAFIIIALSFIGVTFNLNPLLKLDGYYFLVDYWEIPNLRRKAFQYIRQRLLGLARDEDILQVSAKERRIFIYYGLASLI
jgi:putative peptide zinc metalloprotease protein